MDEEKLAVLNQLVADVDTSDIPLRYIGMVAYYDDDGELLEFDEPAQIAEIIEQRTKHDLPVIAAVNVSQIDRDVVKLLDGIGLWDE